MHTYFPTVSTILNNCASIGNFTSLMNTLDQKFYIIFYIFFLIFTNLSGFFTVKSVINFDTVSLNIFDIAKISIYIYIYIYERDHSAKNASIYPLTTFSTSTTFK